MRKVLPLIFCLSLFFAFKSHAQLVEDFHNGDFTTNPVWGAIQPILLSILIFNFKAIVPFQIILFI